MSGKINGIDSRPVRLGGKPSAERTAGKSDSATSASRASGSPVQLTDSAVQLAALEKAIAQLPDVDMQRVEALRAKVQSGEYKADSHRIASKLMELERAIAAIQPDDDTDSPSSES
jgi:negative regulator of flagellin synthesis FlgM